MLMKMKYLIGIIFEKNKNASITEYEELAIL